MAEQVANNQVSKNVSLTRELDAFIGDQVASGGDQNASEVIRSAAWRLFADAEQRPPDGRQPNYADTASRGR
jgi:putative addiction module CopG family antidote